ncbi:PLG [Mytilus edulis]|uniref:PLG n=1 Tax=Mytilus edulis TaxID=6550 RepID=A0A8S3TMH8_MYTED|nr:PLG [Mytilus edulis]
MSKRIHELLEFNVKRKWDVENLMKSIDENWPQSCFDCVLTCGCFVPGHLPPDSLDDCLRFAKKDGKVVITKRANYAKECVDNVEGKDYTGTINTTKNGLKCKDWSNTGSNMTLDTQRLLADQHNYCRNPDSDPFGPWCYTTDDDTLWETCDIPFCEGASTPGWAYWTHGWQQFEDSCYLIKYIKENWYGAKFYCKDNLDAYLAEIKTAGENNFLMNILPKPTIDDTDLEVWLGANTLNAKRRYIWKTSLTDLDFTDWGPGEPNGRSYEHCMSTHMYSDGKLHWNDRECLTKHFFVCEKGNSITNIGDTA